jgi:hypothetical protein
MTTEMQDSSGEPGYTYDGYITGFCGTGLHEGVVKLSPRGARLDPCRFDDICTCSCHDTYRELKRLLVVNLAKQHPIASPIPVPAVVAPIPVEATATVAHGPTTAPPVVPVIGPPPVIAPPILVIPKMSGTLTIAGQTVRASSIEFYATPAAEDDDEVLIAEDVLSGGGVSIMIGSKLAYDDPLSLESIRARARSQDATPRPKGALDLLIRLLCSLWESGKVEFDTPGNICTPQVVGENLFASPGAVSAAWARWESAGECRLAKKPARFLGFGPVNG